MNLDMFCGINKGLAINFKMCSLKKLSILKKARLFGSWFSL